MPILPEPQRRGEIKFKFAKSLPYNVRLALIAFFLILGAALQFTLRDAWLLGVPFLAAGTLLSLIHGYDNKLRSAPAHKEWVRVTRAQFDHVVELSEKSKSWDQTFLDITCPRGFLALLAIAGVSVYLYCWLSRQGKETLATMGAVDMAVLVLPHWVVGIRSILKNAPLVIKIQNLLGVADAFPALSKEGEELQYMLEIGETSAGKTPADAKMVLAFHNGPPEFLGLQLQLAINNVQGADYPYFYCVLVARPAFGLLEKYRPHLQPDITVEKSREKDVHIIVIRQTTTQTSGYHTKPADVRTLFHYALAETRKALQDEG
jgi:hypothetical protein